MMISPSLAMITSNSIASLLPHAQRVTNASSRCSRIQTASGSTLRRLNMENSCIGNSISPDVFALVAKRGVFVTAGNSPLGS
jgi:hypothetical protein